MGWKNPSKWKEKGNIHDKQLQSTQNMQNTHKPVSKTLGDHLSYSKDMFTEITSLLSYLMIEKLGGQFCLMT